MDPSTLALELMCFIMLMLQDGSGLADMEHGADVVTESTFGICCFAGQVDIVSPCSHSELFALFGIFCLILHVCGEGIAFVKETCISMLGQI